ncbi:M15 family metallopeptidase [Baaleninema sp.]|uniref:M15 family metallopeptidase n=1 Tax=Baaleninema sp. TaxID=3101197 RepID=UPI003D02D36E
MAWVDRACQMTVALLSIWGLSPSIATAQLSSPSTAPLTDVTSPPTAEPKLDCSVTSAASMYGHFPYPEAPQRDLVSVGNGQSLRAPAAASFLAMQQAAARDGVQLVPLSGFRDRSTQYSLFFGGARQRGQSLSQRARVSAPPGYSEHHTGYAIDIGDANAPEYDVHPHFEMSMAGMWLRIHAGEYGFELSFPRTHPCVSYEPWHWRWVGDAESQTTFATARDMVREDEGMMR